MCVETFATDFFKNGDISLEGVKEIVIRNFGEQQALINNVLIIPPRILYYAEAAPVPYELKLDGAGLEECQVWRIKFSGSGETHLQIVTRK